MTRADDVIRLLGLSPLPVEGGWFRETWRSDYGTAIYYLLTLETFSAIHRLPGVEVFHFYLGDPVEMLQLRDDGAAEVVVLGHDLDRGMRPQVVVPGGVWQGCRLAEGGRLALMGTTMAPGFDPRDFELARRADLLARHPAHAARIRALTAADRP